jgi:hypothetical protein
MDAISSARNVDGIFNFSIALAGPSTSTNLTALSVNRTTTHFSCAMAVSAVNERNVEKNAMSKDFSIVERRMVLSPV